MKPALGGTALLAAVLAAGAVWLSRPHPEHELRPLPAPPAPAFVIPRPRPLAEPRPAARWAAVVRLAAARSSPSLAAPVRTLLEPRTPEGTANMVLVLRRSVGARGSLWVKVSMPGLPGRTTGWVPRRALGAYHAVRTRLFVDLEGRTATLLRDGKAVFRAPVGVGSAAFPTPRGDFYVRNRLTRFASRFYGPLAFGTSAQSASVTDWPGGGFVGIHGTDRPELLPGAVSHGCIRLRNEDVVRLGHLMPVGTPVSIR